MNQLNQSTVFRMKKTLLLSLCMLLGSSLLAQDTLRVLFLGNSYTGVNDLPQLTSSLTQRTSHVLIVDSNTPGGHTLEGHSENGTSLIKIKQGNWDFVVLQEQSQIPTIAHYRNNSMYPGAHSLKATIKEYNPCAKIVMYMTWGRRFGGKQCDSDGNCSPDFVDFSHMQDSLESAYVEIANQLGAYVAPVGVSWKNVIENTENVLHSSDNSHPNLMGSYLAACVFHSVFWNESPVGLAYFAGLDSDLASYFQQVADETVFQSSSSWNLDLEEDEIVADFSSQKMDEQTVQFTNLTEGGDTRSYLWDFGDNTTSTEEHPSHIYTENNQTYEVSLQVTGCTKSDEKRRAIQVNTLSMDNTDLTFEFSFYPNPFQSQLTIDFPRNQQVKTAEIEIMTLQGTILLTKTIASGDHQPLSLESLPSGVYLLRVTDDKQGKGQMYRLLKQ